MAQDTTATSAVDVGSLLDFGRWAAWQKLVTLLAAMAVLFDGFDIQILGVAIPSIMRDWHVARGAFAPIAALGLGGMAVGSPLAGYCGDRFGRRITLIGCVLIFGLATIATAFCDSLMQMGILRTLAGVGIGGALPNAAALTAEFAPLRRRAVAVTLTIVCVPLGSMIAGLAAARVLPALGWHTLYLIGGAAPLLYAILLAVALPESPRYLTLHAERAAELIRTLARMGHAFPEGTAFHTGHGRESGKAGSLKDLFSPELLQDTVGLWLGYFASLVATYLVLGWLPAMLASHGLEVGTASAGMAAYNFGGVFGVLVCSMIITRLGSRRPMLWSAFGGAASALALLLVPIVPAGEHNVLIGGIGLMGLFMNTVQTTMFALASHVYPTRVRATGVACAAAVGRGGAVISSFAGAAIIQAGGGAFLKVIAAALGITFIGLAIVRNHYPERK
jgi:AAHS family 4-hydroxybenzoate transporter-like MFS transporter